MYVIILIIFSCCVIVVTLHYFIVRVTRKRVFLSFFLLDLPHVRSRCLILTLRSVRAKTHLQYTLLYRTHYAVMDKKGCCIGPYLTNSQRYYCNTICGRIKSEIYHSPVIQYNIVRTSANKEIYSINL